MWLYAYQQGIAWAREVSRRIEWEPGLGWLCGMEVINVQTLCSFRLQQKETLEDLMAQVLAALAEEKLLDLRVVVQDGTKMQPRGSKGSGRRRATLQQHSEQAKAYIEQLDSQAAENSSEGRRRRQAALQSRASERLQRLESALSEMTRRPKRTARSARKYA